HYINATNKPIDAQSAVNITLADPTAHNIPSGSMAILNTDLNIPPGPNGTADVTCTMQRDINAWFFIPHMHNWGSHILVEKIPVGSAAAEPVFDLDWQPEYTFHPPEIRRDPSNPFVLKAGDKIHVHCEWNNDSGNNLTFGLEMCVAFGATIDDQNL